MSEFGKPVALEARDNDGERQMSPSAARNLAPIMEAFESLGLVEGRVLEIGCGTGEHAANIVRHFENLSWLATDLDPASVASCNAWAGHYALGDRLMAEPVNAAAPPDYSERGPFDIVYSSNVIHIAPIEVLDGILAVAGATLKPGGAMVFYGPFQRDGVHTAESNQAFDARLKDRDPLLGVRDLERDVVPRAKKNRLALETVRAMPANNFFVVFRKEA